MPQFLNQRYNGTVAMIMAIFWLLLYIVVNPHVYIIPWCALGYSAVYRV